MAFSKPIFVDNQTVIDADTLNAIQDELIRVAGLLGKDIQSAAINDSGHLILTLTDGTTLDAGVAKGVQGEKGATGPAGPQGPAGAPGKDGAGMDITGATVGQIAKIAAVDESGAPTAWEPVDMPSGGGDGEWVFAGSVTAESAGMVLKVSNIHAKHILVSLYASCDDDSKRTYVIRLNDTITYLRTSALPGNGEKHLWAVEFELLTGGDENYIYCRVIPDESHYTSKSNDLVSSFSSTAVQGTMWYKVNISEFNSVAFLSGNGTTSAGNIMNVWYR